MSDAVLPAVLSVPVGILAVLVLGLAVLYSLKIAGELLAGYRRSSSRDAAAVAVGLLFVTTIPIVLRFGLSTLGLVSPPVVRVLAATSALLGLTVVLLVVYGGGDRR